MQNNALILRPEAVYLPNYCVEQTNESLNTINFTEYDIFKEYNIFTEYNIFIIRKLDPSKAHAHDEISIRMAKICDKAICNHYI